MSACTRCGQAGMRGVTHICPPPPTVMTTGPLDVHHWLYKAGYEDGYQAALREYGVLRSPSGKERGE